MTINLRALTIFGCAVFPLGFIISCGASKAMKIGEQAPDFSLPDQNGARVKLSDFRGKQSVVLAFYIKAFTPG